MSEEQKGLSASLPEALRAYGDEESAKEVEKVLTEGRARKRPKLWQRLLPKG